jgi:DNA-binding beta-propeller fold protein YncE
MCAGVAQAAPRASKLLVLEKGSLTLAVVDPQTFKIVARIPVGPDPHEVSTSDDGTRAYVSEYQGEGSKLDIIAVVDLIAYKALPTIKLEGLRSTHGLDFVGGKLYFTAETNKAIGRYDPVTQHVDWTLGTGQDRTHMIVVQKDLKHIFTSNVRSGTISIIEGREASVGNPAEVREIWEVSNVPSGRESEGFDVSPDGKQIWAANGADGTVTVIDVDSKKARETFPVPADGANRLKFTVDGKYVLIAGLGPHGPGTAAGLGNMTIVDVATHQVVKRLDLGGGAAGIVMDPNGERAFVAVNRANKVAVIDLKALSVSGEIPLSQPDGINWLAGHDR